MSVCSIKDCEKKVRTRGYCIGHYGRVHRGTDVNKPLYHRGEYKVCKIDGCNKPIRARYLCIGHYHRIKKGQDMRKPFQPRKLSPITITCNHCGINKEVRASVYYTQYCSRSCAQKNKTGSKNPNWKGGITNIDREERNRFAREMRDLVFARDYYTCQICDDEASGHLHVDHIKQWADYPELRFDPENCRTLCRECHYYITYKRKIPKTSTWGLSGYQNWTLKLLEKPT